MTETLSGERIGVLGLARSGLAAAKLALSRGASVYASDFSDSPASRAAADEVRALGGEAETGRHDVGKLAACDFIVLSPGIPPTAPVLSEPALREVPILPELEFAYRGLEVPVIAVTGTNGKTTVTSLATHLLRAGGVDAVSGGNIGVALSEIALRSPRPEAVVVEASSFQLGRTRGFAPSLGVLTNLAPDHLDWYADVREYYADKARLFRNATARSRWVVNGEDGEVRGLLGDTPGERFWFRIASQPEPGERGAFLAPDGRLALRLDGVTEEPLLPVDELRILGPHNVANSLAAALVARLWGAAPDVIASGLRSFEALKHRMEPVAEVDGVLWINDSKATNVASASVALRSVARPTILLLGGRHKGEPYSELVPDMLPRVRRVLAYGEAGERIRADLAGRVPVERLAGPFEEVVARAAELARPGEVVLLSPACSSYDMFAHYEERGTRFRELVLERRR